MSSSQDVGDIKAMRDALEMMSDLFAKGVICTSYANTPEEIEQIEELYRKAKSALSVPPRNCDVGTAKEQDERFDAFCVARNGWSCTGCPDAVGGFTVANGIRECALVWAQMPYEEGGVK